MKISIKKSIACLLAVISVLLPFNLSVKAATYLDKSVFEAGENHFVYLCPPDTDGIIINWYLELFSALNFEGKWALYDFYGTQLTDYVFDGFYGVLHGNSKNAFDAMTSAPFIDENIKGYIGNKDYILTRDKYAIISTLADESESHNPDRPEPTPSASLADQTLLDLFGNITPSEEMPFTTAYALKDFVLVENVDIDGRAVYGILSYDGEIVLSMRDELKGPSFLITLKYDLFLSYLTVFENRYVVFDTDKHELADVPLIRVTTDWLHYGYAGKNGLTVPCKYTYAESFSDGFASVATGNPYESTESERMIGYIDASGEVALEFYPHEVSHLSNFYDGLARFSSPEFMNQSSSLFSPTNIFYMDKTGRVVIKQPAYDRYNKWHTATDFKNGIAIVSNRMDNHGQGVWVIKYTEGKTLEETKFLSCLEYLDKYAGYPDDENIMNVIGTGIYKDQEILAVTDYPPSDERLFLRLFID